MTARAASITTWVTAILVVTSGCQYLGSFESFEAAPPDPCDDGVSEKDDDRGLTRIVRVSTPKGCSWIDKTEVTVEQYKTFIESTHQEVDWQGLDQHGASEHCAWKEGPSDPVRDGASDDCARQVRDADGFGDTMPIRCIDWCDAVAFCAWAGKRLCYGGTSGITEPTENVSDEWGSACSDQSRTELPYGNGNTFQPGKCRIAGDQCVYEGLQHVCTPGEVGTKPECEGQFGTQDMIGNVAEWIYMCQLKDSALPAAAHTCRYRGGSYAETDIVKGTCHVSPHARRDAREPFIGFRCCSGEY